MREGGTRDGGNSRPPRVDNLSITVDNRVSVWRNRASGMLPGASPSEIVSTSARSVALHRWSPTGLSPIQPGRSTPGRDYSTVLHSVAVRRVHTLHIIITMMTR